MGLGGLTLIVIERFDPHGERVETELERRGLPFLRFHPEDFSQQGCGTYSVDNKGRDSLEIRGHRIAIDDVEAVWYRRASQADIPAAGGRLARLECGAFVQGLWHRLSHVRWVSSPAAIRAASNKFDQLIRAKQCGFRVAATCLSNGQDDVPIFVARHPKAYEVRIAVFGEKVFACRIPSQEGAETGIEWRAHDWDDPASFPPHAATTIPDDLAESCRLLVRDYGLAYGAIDMVVTADGEHVFLELNPNGQWAWIEERTGLKLGNALVDVLQRGKGQQLLAAG